MTPSLHIQPLKTRLFQPQEKLLEFILEHVPQELVAEEMILAVTSKIVSAAENRFLEKSVLTKEQVIEQEAEVNLGAVGYGCFLTVKHGLFIPSAGIDESNSPGGRYILYPENPFASLQRLWEELRQCWGLKNLGLVMTDSHTTPLRKGVTGISLAHWGFQGVRSLVGTPDLFGRPLQMTSVNIADGLAAAATLMMGEANERRPLAVLKGGEVTFTEKTIPEEVKIPLREDLYYPFFRGSLLGKE